MAHHRIKKQRENVTLFNVYFTNSKGRYLFKKPLIFNKKQIYFKMVEHRQGQKRLFCLFQDGRLRTG